MRSRLSLLKRFPPDRVKIDRACVHALHNDPDATLIALTIPSRARNLRLKVLAEGVANSAQLDFLQEHGCDEVLRISLRQADADGGFNLVCANDFVEVIMKKCDTYRFRRTVVSLIPITEQARNHIAGTRCGTCPETAAPAHAGFELSACNEVSCFAHPQRKYNWPVCPKN